MSGAHAPGRRVPEAALPPVSLAPQSRSAVGSSGPSVASRAS
jgi:hypothetical protein